MFQDPRRRNEGMNLGGHNEANIVYQTGMSVWVNNVIFLNNRDHSECLLADC